VLLLAAFVTNERSAAQPIMPLRLFASAERAAAYGGRLLFLGAMMGFWFFITQYFQTVDDWSPLQAGLGFLLMTVVNFIVAVRAPKLTARYGNGLLLAGGLATTTVGMFWLSRLSGDTSYVADVALPMVLIGAGQGATLSPLTAAGGLSANDLLAHRVSVALTVGGAMLVLALVLVLALIVRSWPQLWSVARADAAGSTVAAQLPRSLSASSEREPGSAA
jgi:hypothetical protein